MTAPIFSWVSCWWRPWHQHKQITTWLLASISSQNLCNCLLLLQHSDNKFKVTLVFFQQFSYINYALSHQGLTPWSHSFIYRCGSWFVHPFPKRGKLPPTDLLIIDSGHNLSAFKIKSLIISKYISSQLPDCKSKFAKKTMFQTKHSWDVHILQSPWHKNMY